MTRLKLSIIIAGIAGLAMSLTSCSNEDEDPIRMHNKPPFNDFWFTTKFDVNESGGYEKLQYYSVRARQEGSIVEDDFEYPNTVEGNMIPEGSKLSVSMKNGILILLGEGVIKREGKVLPFNYTGDPELWTTEVKYSASIEANTRTKEIIKATLILESEKFYTEFELTTDVEFREYTDSQFPEWSIGNKDDLVVIPGTQEGMYLRLSFSIDDIYGTTIKN